MLLNTQATRKGNGIQVKTILNRVQKHSAFVYDSVRLLEHPHPPRLTLEVRVRPRVGTRARCSQCRRPAPGYDTLPPRRFDFVPLWQIPVVFRYAMRRVDCPRCGVKVEAIPWASGKHRLTDACAWFLAGWAKRLSWQRSPTPSPPPGTVNGRSILPRCGHRKFPHPLVEYQQQLLRLWALVGRPFFGLSKSRWSRAARPRGRQRPQAAAGHVASVVGLTTPDFSLSFSRYESPRMLIVVA